MTAFSSKWKYETAAISRIPQTKNLIISFLVLHRTAKKFTTIYNARAEQLFFS